MHHVPLHQLLDKEFIEGFVKKGMMYYKLEFLLNPLGPRSPVTARSFALPQNPRPPGSSRLADAHTSISAYANRNGTPARLVASFLLSFTPSGDVLCSKFERHREFSKL